MDLPALVESQLTGEAWEHLEVGLDYLGFGEWQRQYGRWLVDCLQLRGRRLLDVGCACGSILPGFGETGAIVQGADLNEHMIQLGRRKWPDMAPLLFVCDAVHLHLLRDESWDAIHTAQVGEHWKPGLVPFILRELARVAVPGGLLFCALDTEELFARQGRDRKEEDPTHICIRPMSWWREQLVDAGWRDSADEFAPALRRHPETFSIWCRSTATTPMPAPGTTRHWPGRPPPWCSWKKENDV